MLLLHDLGGSPVHGISQRSTFLPTATSTPLQPPGDSAKPFLSLSVLVLLLPIGDIILSDYSLHARSSHPLLVSHMSTDFKCRTQAIL